MKCGPSDIDWRNVPIIGRRIEESGRVSRIVHQAAVAAKEAEIARLKEQLEAQQVRLCKMASGTPQ